MFPGGENIHWKLWQYKKFLYSNLYVGARYKTARVSHTCSSDNKILAGLRSFSTFCFSIYLNDDCKNRKNVTNGGNVFSFLEVLYFCCNYFFAVFSAFILYSFYVNFPGGMSIFRQFYGEEHDYGINKRMIFRLLKKLFLRF